MPVTSWTTAATPAPDVPVHVVVTEFHLPRLRDTLPFLRSTRRITAALSEAEGLVGYALQARILRRTYRTVSAWRSPDDARRFARGGVHGEVAGAARAGNQPKSVARWDAPASETPPSWAHVEEVLTAASTGVTPPPGAGVGSGR
jgi:hypothetical protein